MDCYRSLQLHTVVPVANDLGRAVKSLAPQAAHISQATVIGRGRRSPVFSVGGLIAVKVHGTLDESENLRYVSTHTSVPIPKVFGVYQGDDGTNFLVMDLVKGEPANLVWPSLTSAQKRGIEEQLKDCFLELRGMSADYIGAPGFRRLSSDHLDAPHEGPFRNEIAFHHALLNSIRRRPNFNASFAQKMLKCGHGIVFSHGDFAMKNVLIYEGKLSGIVDWEYAGFYPEYWEYAVASSACDWTMPGLSDWGECIQRMLKPFPVEAAALRTLHDYTIYGM